MNKNKETKNETKARVTAPSARPGLEKSSAVYNAVATLLETSPELGNVSVIDMSIGVLMAAAYVMHKPETMGRAMDEPLCSLRKEAAHVLVSMGRDEVCLHLVAIIKALADKKDSLVDSLKDLLQEASSKN